MRLNRLVSRCSAAGAVLLFKVACAVVNARRTRIRAARATAVSLWQVLRDVVCFGSLPGSSIGLRSGIFIALLTMIVAQMPFNLPTIDAAIFVAGALCYSQKLLFLRLATRFFHWAEG